MVLRAAVNGTYLGAAFEPFEPCGGQHVWQGAEAVDKHSNKLNDKDDTENDDKR